MRYYTAIGFRIKKVQVNKHDDHIEIKPNGWLDKREWREINEILANMDLSGSHVV